MNSRTAALDILIEDLALQLLSSAGAAHQAKVLEERLERALEARTAGAARKGKRAVASSLEIERALTGMTGRAGGRVQETRALVRTLEWNLRYYIRLRESDRASGSRSSGKPSPRTKKSSAGRKR